MLAVKTDQSETNLTIWSVTSVTFMNFILKTISGSAIENYVLSQEDKGDLCLTNAYVRTDDRRRHVFTHYGWKNGAEDAGSVSLTDEEFEMLNAI